MGHTANLDDSFYNNVLNMINYCNQGYIHWLWRVMIDTNWILINVQELSFK